MRFPIATVRVFQSRASTGVRGIALAEGDEVISMSLVDSGKGITTEEREGYLRQSRALRQAESRGRIAAKEAGTIDTLRRSASRSCRPRKNSCSPLPRRASASARRPTNIG
jgi:DNA gyrase/topoisomerase IV subunit A